MAGRSTAAASTARSCSGTSAASAGRPSVRAPARRPRGLALSPDGRTVAVAHADGTVRWSTLGTLRTRSLRVGDAALGGVAFLRDGQSAGDGSARPRSPAATASVIDRRERPDRTAPRRTGLAAGAERRRRRAAGWRWSVAAPRWSSRWPPAARPGAPRYYRRRGGALSVALSPDGRSLAVATERGHRDRRRRPHADPLVPDRVRHDRGAAARSRPTGACWRPAAARAGCGCGRPRLEARLAQARRPQRRRARARHQPGRAHAGLGRRGRHRAPLRPRDAAAARRAAARRRRTARRPQSFSPDGALPVRVTDGGRPSAGTSARRRGSATPAPSPGARSPAPSGPTPSPAATTPRPAGPSADSTPAPRPARRATPTHAGPTVASRCRAALLLVRATALGPLK